MMKKVVTAVVLSLCSLTVFAQGSKTCDDNRIEWGKIEFLDKKPASSSSVIDQFTYYELTESSFTLYEFELYNGDTTAINYYKIDFSSLKQTPVLISEGDAGNRSGKPFEFGFMCSDFSIEHIEFGKFSCSSIWGKSFKKTKEKAIYLAFTSAEARNKIKEIIMPKIKKI